MSFHLHAVALTAAVAMSMGRPAAVERPRPPSHAITFVMPSAETMHVMFQREEPAPARPVVTPEAPRSRAESRAKPLPRPPGEKNVAVRNAVPAEAPDIPSTPLPVQVAELVPPPAALPLPTAPSAATVIAPPQPTVGLFDQARAPRAAAATSATVVAAGFGSAGPERRARPTQEDVVRAAGFDVRPAPPVVAPVSRRTEGADRPVEIVFKPQPAYTREAKALGVEGSVVLDVEFTAAGGVRVLRVVSGLGHGLDEAAVGAAELIQFKPARRGGNAVDVRTTVHIVFRLT